ncbi:MAG: hypothetical protein AAF787_14845, partial [Chloroflexota bacterium]
MVMVRAVTRIVYGLLALMVGAALFGRWATDPLMLRVSYSESTGNSFEPPHHFQLIDVQKSHAVFLDKNTPLAQHWNTITNEHLYSDIVYPSPDGAQYYIATYGDTENTSGLYWQLDNQQRFVIEIYDYLDFILGFWDSSSEYFYFKYPVSTQFYQVKDDTLNEFGFVDWLTCSPVDSDICALLGYRPNSAVESRSITLLDLKKEELFPILTRQTSQMRIHALWSPDTLRLYMVLQGEGIIEYDVITNTLKYIYEFK